jgi:hypothetical protein
MSTCVCNTLHFQEHSLIVNTDKIVHVLLLINFTQNAAFVTEGWCLGLARTVYMYRV